MYEVVETVVEVMVEHVLELEGSVPSHEFNDDDDETCIVERGIFITIIVTIRSKK